MPKFFGVLPEERRTALSGYRRSLYEISCYEVLFAGGERGTGSARLDQECHRVLG
jgi:hypothetical protein